MLKYTISCLFLLSTILGIAQSEPIDLQPKDTVVRSSEYGIRFGVDLSRLAFSFLKEDYQGLELVGDYRLSENLYIAAEIGNEEKTHIEKLGNIIGQPQGELYSYTTSGSYIKLGVDLNTYDNWFGMNNSIYIGGRFATAKYSQTLHDYRIFNTNRYWSPDQFANGINDSEKFTGINASWLEAVLGLKAELFANIYLGASVRLAYLVSSSSNKLNRLWIPGFNKVTDESKFGTSYNYSITYLLPLYKKAKKKKKESTLE